MIRCECPAAGFCDRHQVAKGERMHELCDHPDHPAYWDAWEAGYGPGQRSRGLGDVVAKTIVAATDGRVKQCGGCKQRQAKLNEIAPSRQN